ncbi:unnamed protein product [Spirodela intermedia]|uniref:Amine oxidase domain-containing protein n=1 Tax=Spirodela intermedia TaxID=51605 RepID=A0A7I8IHB1_SPIIN|nr:unnamed protein product [Spirodela intermedia]CAA6657265.1 unnamed protein product [Spirodela intermedia]
MMLVAFLRILLLAIGLEGDGVTARPDHDPSAIIVGAGISGASDAGIEKILILEATDRIGGRIQKVNFGGHNVEVGAHWVDGVNGKDPVWTFVNKLNLRAFIPEFNKISSSVYQQDGDEDMSVLLFQRLQKQ